MCLMIAVVLNQTLLVASKVFVRAMHIHQKMLGRAWYMLWRYLADHLRLNLKSWHLPILVDFAGPISACKLLYSRL
jgi:hypothetical protein